MDENMLAIAIEQQKNLNFRKICPGRPCRPPSILQLGMGAEDFRILSDIALRSVDVGFE